MKIIKAKIYPMDKSDYVKFFYLLCRKKNKEMWIGFIGAIFIILTILLVIPVVLFTQSGRGEFNSQLIFLVIVAFFLLILILATDNRIRTMAKNSVDSNAIPVYYNVDCFGFSKLDSHENNKSIWTDFTEAIVSKNNIILVDNENSISFISKNYTKEEFEQIKIWVKNNIKEI